MKLPLKYLIALLSLALAMQVGHVTASMRIADSGEVLLFPYYAAGEGYNTYVSITNTTGMVKGARVAIREGMRGNEVLSWHIYLAPYEQMGFAIFQNSDGGAVLTNSTACTVPAFPQSVPVDFVNYAYVGDSVNTLDRTLSGYLEVIEMGQWDPAAGLGAALGCVLRNAQGGIAGPRQRTAPALPRPAALSGPRGICLVSRH